MFALRGLFIQKIIIIQQMQYFILYTYFTFRLKNPKEVTYLTS